MFVFLGEVIGGLGWRGKRAGGYARTVAGLGWYLGWPFGKYVEGKGYKKKRRDSEDDDALDVDPAFQPVDSEETLRGVEGEDSAGGSENTHHQSDQSGHFSESESSSSGRTIRGNTARTVPVLPRIDSEDPTESLKTPASGPHTESTPLIPPGKPAQKGHVQHVDFAKVPAGHARSSLYGAIGGYTNGDAKHTDSETQQVRDTSVAWFENPKKKHSRTARICGGLVYWPLFIVFIAPTLGIVCLLCWGLVFTIPMAKLTWFLLRHMAKGPLDIKFRSAPTVAVPASPSSSPELESDRGESQYTVRRAYLKAGQLAPTPGADSTVLLCTYRALGLQYYKYTVGGVNIIFVNLLPLVFFTIIDGFFLLPKVEHSEDPNPILKVVASQGLIFILGLSSVIPLSYFIGMAVASISAQSSIGMGAVINATFGSIIEIILYSIALTQGKGKLVEGSIVGSLLAGVLLMPGMSMISGAFKRKEQKFNAKSAGVTSTMLIMAIIGTLTPTLFYQTYGSVSNVRGPHPRSS